MLLVFQICGLATARPAPEGFEGVITQLNSNFVTIKNQQGPKVFNIQQAGICGWPTKKKITDVFKITTR